MIMLAIASTVDCCCGSRNLKTEPENRSIFSCFGNEIVLRRSCHSSWCKHTTRKSVHDLSFAFSDKMDFTD